MNTTNRFSRVLSLRDKRHPHKHRSPEVDHNGLFTLENGAKKPSKDEEKKINDLSQQLTTLGLTTVPEARVQYAIRRSSMEGGSQQAFSLLMLFEDSIGGILKPYDPSVKMLGAENREKVTCYLDALLFAMFAKGDVFDAILFNNFTDEPRKRLISVMRLWVNMLRTGRLITTDVTQHLQEAIADCGWPEATKLRQQDASEVFGFLTDKLDLPLLTLQTDLFHSGKEDTSDDHKFVTERLLDVAIPEEAQNGVVTLEKCLEEYFNNRVEVKRELQRRNTLQRTLSKPDPEKPGATHVETIEIESPAPTPLAETPRKPAFMRPTYMRERATSIFSERKVEINAAPASDKNEASTTITNGRPRNSSMRKEVLMPAWQFISLIPWYADNTNEGAAQAAMHFSTRRPMLGICLKRYVVSKTGTTSRLGTHVDIPLEMSPPHFAIDNESLPQDDTPSTSNFKLVLQSVVCHRGATVYSGHYVALVRVGQASDADSFAEVPNGRSKDQRHDKWIMLDDIAAERVTTVDINKALHDETPYLLFYRVQPIDDASSEEDPPPYTESEASLATVDEKLAHLRNQSESSLDRPEWRSRRTSAAISEGFAASDEGRAVNSMPDDRRSSIAFTDGSTAASVHNYSPTVEPTPSQDEVKSPPLSLSRHTTKNKAGKPLAKITSKLSRDKLASSDTVTANDGTAKTVANEVTKSKVKEKKSKLRNKNASKETGKGPDRECTVM
ncbi:MAG: hypothetical protein M1828_005189 [Chrysothrix sp. TS-e1954]|nr:MAG: hypothetical protein M1828_005189 [Chrysothrix sp. TS-e1954]